MIAAPITGEHGPLGVIEVATSVRPDAFHDHDAAPDPRLCQAAIAITNAWLIADLPHLTPPHTPSHQLTNTTHPSTQPSKSYTPNPILTNGLTHTKVDDDTPGPHRDSSKRNFISSLRRLRTVPRQTP